MSVRVLPSGHRALTPEERNVLRLLVDAYKRERLAAFRMETGRTICSRCYCDADEKTPGCNTCWNRHRNRERWADPDYHQRRIESQRRLRATRRAA